MHGIKNVSNVPPNLVPSATGLQIMTNAECLPTFFECLVSLSAVITEQEQVDMPLMSSPCGYNC